jgi:DNA-binding NarL/FixJ family response regulator
MDIAMAELNGIDATRLIRRAEWRAPKVVALSAYSERRHVTQMLEAGATGFVAKQDAFEELAEALRTVLGGGVYLSPALKVQDLVRPGADGASAGGPKLSPRERQVLQLVAEGKATKETARHLSLSVKTVETHRRNIMDKLDLHSTAELTKYALREGITPL